jgi:hypothetical protein
MQRVKPRSWLAFLFILFLLLAPSAVMADDPDTPPGGDPDSPGYDPYGPRLAPGFGVAPGPRIERPRSVVVDRSWKERLHRVLWGLRAYYLKF